VFVVFVVYFVIDSVRKLSDIPSNTHVVCRPAPRDPSKGTGPQENFHLDAASSEVQ